MTPNTVCDLSHDAFDVTYPIRSPCERTDAYENITFPKLCLWVVNDLLCNFNEAEYNA